MKTSHFAALVIILRNSRGNSQATSETIFCLIGKWSLGNEFCRCPVTHLLPSPPEWIRSFVFGLPKVLVFHLNISNQRIMWDLDYSKLPTSLNSHPSTGFQFLWSEPWGPVRGFITVFLLFLLPCLCSCSLLCCSSLSPLFHHHCCWHSFVSHYRCTGVTHRIFLSLRMFFLNVWAQEVGMCRERGKCKISPVSYFSWEDLSLIYEHGALPSTCTPVMYPSDENLGQSAS